MGRGVQEPHTLIRSVTTLPAPEASCELPGTSLGVAVPQSPQP